MIRTRRPNLPPDTERRHAAAATPPPKGQTTMNEHQPKPRPHRRPRALTWALLAALLLAGSGAGWLPTPDVAEPAAAAFPGKNVAGARRLDAVAAENVCDAHEARRSDPRHRLEPDAHIVRPDRPEGQDARAFHDRPVDINKDWPCDDALVGDAGLVIEALIEEIGRQRKTSPAKALAALKEEIAAEKKAWRAEWAKHLDSDEVPINQYRVIRDMMRTLDRDNVIITHDSGSPREQLLPTWETTKAGTYMGWGKSTQLGYGLALALGARLAAPDKMCINIMGDASFGMTGMDIETAARNEIGITTVVFNNQVMAAERHVLQRSHNKFRTLDIGGNYSKVAEGLNVASRRVEKPSEIVAAIKEAVAENGKSRPFLIEIVAKEGYDFSRYEY